MTMNARPIWNVATLDLHLCSRVSREEPSQAACAFMSRRAAQAGLKANALRRHESSEYGSSTSLETATTTNLHTTIKYRVGIHFADLQELQPYTFKNADL